MKILKTIFFITAIALFITIGFTTCKKPKEAATGTVTVTFTPAFNGLPFSFDSIYSDSHGNYFDFNYLALYLSDFSLVKSDNSLVDIDTVVFFDFDQPQSDPGWGSFSVTAPTGSYTGIQFNVGLNAADDFATITDSTIPALAGHNNMYWGTSPNGIKWGYRFVDLEGNSSTNSDFSGTPNSLDYHVGTDTAYRTNVTASGPTFSIGGGNNNFNLTLDIYKIFYSGSGLNFVQYPGTQSLPTSASDMVTAKLFANQIIQAFSYSKQ